MWRDEMLRMWNAWTGVERWVGTGDVDCGGCRVEGMRFSIRDWVK